MISITLVDRGDQSFTLQYKIPGACVVIVTRTFSFTGMRFPLFHIFVQLLYIDSVSRPRDLYSLYICQVLQSQQTYGESRYWWLDWPWHMVRIVAYYLKVVMHLPSSERFDAETYGTNA